MKDEDVLRLVLEDDRLLEQEKQTKRLTSIEDYLAPNDAYYVVELDLTNNTYSSQEVFNCQGMMRGRSFTIESQSIDYWYEIERGKKVKVSAGDAVTKNHAFESLRISTDSTHASTMQIYLSGRKIENFTPE